MIKRIIATCLEHRTIVALMFFIITAISIWAVKNTPIDAIPDLSDVQVIVYSPYNGQAPQVVDEQVTYPLTTALLSVPGAKNVRGYSFFGFSLIYIIFDESTDLYWARSRVLEYLNFAKGRLPEGVTPQLGPDATGVGWVYMYAVTDFLPRAEILRANLGNHGAAKIALGQLPEPSSQARDEGEVTGEGELLTYPSDQLVHFFLDETRPEPERTRYAKESARYIVECFDENRDGEISKSELLSAINYRGTDLAQLRSIQDWYLKYSLMSVPGVSEIASVGGYVKQYQVDVDPEKLRAFNIPLHVVKKAIKRSNIDVGGRAIEMGETEYMVRGKGYIRGVDDLNLIPLSVDKQSHVPILLGQVANVHTGPEIRRGLVEMNGEGEVVAGIVVMRSGENALDVIEGVKERLESLKQGLPAGVELHTSYDRSTLIQASIKTLKEKIFEEMLIVALICFIFLLHFRSALVAVVTIPVAILMSFLLMKWFGITANIMSLGGIALAIGVMVDASIVMVENLHKHKEHSPNEDHLTLVLRASSEVGPALFFSLLVITVSFLPVFTLEQQEGRLFSPLAYTKTFSMAAASLVAITLIPVLMFYFVKGSAKPESKNPINRFLVGLYRPIIQAVLKYPRSTIGAGLAIMGLSVLPFFSLGSEFMPPLNEGDLLYMPTTPPGISITKAKELLQQTDRLIKSHPQVEHVLGKIGRAETATDPAPLSMIETTIILTPQHEWPNGKTMEDIIQELNARVQIPGLTNAWTMPIKTRIDMLATGIKTPVGIKLLGDNLGQLSDLGEKIEALLKSHPDVLSVFAERAVGGNYIDIDLRRADAARFGLNAADVQDVVRSAIGGVNVTWTVEGLERYPVNVRFPRELRSDLDKLKRVAVPTKMNHTVPLGAIADIRINKGPPAIKSENAQRTAWVYIDLKSSDIGGFVSEAKKLVRDNIDIPQGVSMVWSGQYEYMERAKEKLKLAIPLTLAIILILLYLHFRNFAQPLMVMLGVPFAAIGGIWLCFFAGFNLSVAIAVGFIALAGLAAETSVVMLVYLDNSFHKYISKASTLDESGLKSAVTEGAVDRLRPKIMTVATTICGLLPIMFGTGIGTRVMKRIAAPMVGGLVSSAILTLVLIPAIYYLWKKREISSKVV